MRKTLLALTALFVTFVIAFYIGAFVQHALTQHAATAIHVGIPLPMPPPPVSYDTAFEAPAPLLPILPTPYLSYGEITYGQPMPMPVTSPVPIPVGAVTCEPVGFVTPVAVAQAQINFLGVESLEITYADQVPGTFDSAPLVLPTTHDFGQGAIYRLKLSNIPCHPGKELFPTLEVAPVTAETQGFFAHSSVPVEFTSEDFDQVFSGSFITKVVYLPHDNPTLPVTTQFQSGVNPVVEANKDGSILAIIRLGNKNLSSRTSMPRVCEPTNLVQ